MFFSNENRVRTKTEHEGSSACIAGRVLTYRSIETASDRLSLSCPYRCYFECLRVFCLRCRQGTDVPQHRNCFTVPIGFCFLWFYCWDVVPNPTKGFAFGNHHLLKKVDENFCFPLRCLVLRRRRTLFFWFHLFFLARKRWENFTELRYFRGLRCSSLHSWCRR